MTEELTKRKLTAILSADVKGYSRLMQDNEEDTVRTISAYREVMTGLIEGQNGKVVDAKGDNLLAEFPSVVDAVRCGVMIQNELKVKNNELPENRKMEFRIGINLGDVIEEEDTIYGDGVNIAARLEGLAEGGGICISRMAFDNVKNKLDIGYEYLGEHSVKNIAEPVRVYKVLMEPEYVGKVIGEERPKPKQWRFAAVTSAIALILVAGAFAVWHFYFQPPPIEPASIENMAHPLPEKPSIAVLAFENMSDDPKQEYFSDGISEDIITALSKTDQLFVIARNSTFTYKGKPVKVKQVAEELGVRYVLEGSVRKSEDRVRITAQLIDATKGHHLWAKRYDRDLKDIFTLQDEITMKIVTALQVKLTEGEQARLWSKKTKNLDLLLKRMETMSLWRKGTKESLIRFGQIGQEVIDMAPEDSLGYKILGRYYWGLATRGKSPRENLKKAFQLAQKVLTMDESDAHAHALLGIVYLKMRQHEKAIAEGKRAIEFDPNGAHVHGLLGFTLSFAGRPDEAIKYVNQAIRLNPFPPYQYFRHLGRSYLLKGQYEDALTAYKKALYLAPKNLFNHASLAITYALLDRQEEAEAAVKKTLEIDPSVSVKPYAKLSPFKNQADLKLVIDAMRKAGFPE